MKPPILIFVSAWLAFAGCYSICMLPTRRIRCSRARRARSRSRRRSPAVIRAGLLQSTLIVLPPEEKVANVFARRHGELGIRRRPRGFAVHQHQAQSRQRARPTFTSSPTTATSTRLQLREVSSDQDPHFDSKVFIEPGDRPPKTDSQSSRLRSRVPNWTR